MRLSPASEKIKNHLINNFECVLITYVQNFWIFFQHQKFLQLCKAPLSVDFSKFHVGRRDSISFLNSVESEERPVACEETLKELDIDNNSTSCLVS
jgi:hypothetical protein